MNPGYPTPIADKLKYARALAGFALLASVSLAQAQTNWRWAEPLPQGNALHAARISGQAADLGTQASAASSSGPSVVIGGGFSGNWFNPTGNQGGHGFQIEVLPNNGMLAIWFVFNPAGTAQNWIYSQGSYDPNSNDAVLPAFLEQGGAFPPNFDGTKVTAPAWGSLEFKFTDCSNGTAEFTPNETALNAGYGHVSFPIQRLTTITGTTCP